MLSLKFAADDDDDNTENVDAQTWDGFDTWAKKDGRSTASLFFDVPRDDRGGQSNSVEAADKQSREKGCRIAITETGGIPNLPHLQLRSVNLALGQAETL